MKINSLKIKSYGHFTDRKFEFSEGLNIICGSNGSGKSTISTALKTFLYKDVKGDGKYKKRYIPIGEQRGAFDVCFETDENEKYESCVTAGLTSGRTVVHTLKLSDNSELSGGVEIGEYFFNASEEMYDSVCYIREPEDFGKVSENNIPVNEMLSANSVSERASADLSAAISSLNDELLLFGRRTNSGLIYPKECELTEINEAMSRFSELIVMEKRLTDREEKIKLLIAEKTDKRIKLSKLRDEQEKYENAFKNSVPDNASERKEELEKRLNELSYEYELLSDDELFFLKTPDADIKRSYLLPVILGVLGMLSLCAGSLNKIFFAPGLVLCAVAVIAFFTFINKNRLFEEKLHTNKKRKEELLRFVGCNTLEEYENKLKKITEDEAEKKIIRRELERLKSMIPTKNAFVFLNKPLGSYSETVKEMEKINEEISDLKIELEQVTERRKNLFNNLPVLNELAEKKEELIKEIENLRQEEEVTLAAKLSLESTRDVYKTAYLPAVSKRAEEILWEVENRYIDKLILNEHFRPSVRDKDCVDIKGEEYLSSGISDSVYFAVRLAVCEFAFKEKESPVLILDDPFIRMDDERAGRWLLYLSKNTDVQTIFFTSGKRIFNLGLENTTTLGL